MARMNVKTDVQGPDQITIYLVREDYLEMSNTFRIFFEVCLAIAGVILGSIVSLLNENKEIPALNWFILIVTILGCISFLILTVTNYKKAKCKSTD